MTDFEVVKKMIKKIEDRDIEIDCLGAFQTITIDYVVLEFEDEKLIDIWKYWEISCTKTNAYFYLFFLKSYWQLSKMCYTINTVKERRTKWLK